MVFDWFKKVNHALQIDVNNGQVHKGKNKDTFRKKNSLPISEDIKETKNK